MLQHGNVATQKQQEGNPAGKGNPETQRIQEQPCALGSRLPSSSFSGIPLARAQALQCSQDLSPVSLSEVSLDDSVSRETLLQRWDQ